jgi:hypothetical protein
VSESVADIADTANLRRAIRFVLHDKEDEVVVDPLNDIPFLENLDVHIPDLSAKLRNGTYEPRRVTVVETARGAFTTRPLSVMEFDDWLVAQAILSVVGEKLDSKIPAASFAFRLNPDRDRSSRDKFFKAWYREWPRFVRRIRSAVSATYPCLVVTDIAGYFEQIDLPLLSDMILAAGIPPETVNLIFSQLEKWRWREGFAISRNRGLLQGNDLASAYANFYLSDIDESLEQSGVKHQRFMDDFAIHVKTPTEGKRTLRELAIALRRKGLTLNKAKTRILEGDKTEEHFSWHVTDDLEANLKALKSAGDVAHVRQERHRLKRVVFGLRVPNPHVVKRLMTAYTWARDPRFRSDALRLLVDRPDLTPNLCRYFRALDTDANVKDLAGFLSDPSRNIYVSQEHAIIETLLLMSVRASEARSRLRELAKARLGNFSVDAYSRALYVLLMYKCGATGDIEPLVDRYLRNVEKDPLPRKHLALAVTRLNDPQRFDAVVDRLVREADTSLSDIGLFIDEVRRAPAAKVRSVIRRTSLSQDYYAQTPKQVVSRLRLRDLIILNICRQSTDPSIRQVLRRRFRAWQSRVVCPTAKQLLAEAETRT